MMNSPQQERSQTRATSYISPPSPLPTPQPLIPNLTNHQHPSRPISPLLESIDGDDTSSTRRSFRNDVRPKQRRRSLNEKQQKRKRDVFAQVNDWWWWEISSAVLSIVCMVLLLILLLKSDNRPLEAWTLPIQPSSLIAVFTTVAKTSMMVPIASCLSQLKWRHFMRRSDRLYSLQLFDEASRGPWGSTMLLLTLRKRAILAWGLSIVTVISLGIDPSAQQILDFPTRTSTLTNATAILGRAGNYVSKAYFEGQFVNSNFQVPKDDLLKLQTAILNGASGNVFQPTFDCPAPATSCQWDELTTLGICVKFENMTDVATRNCTGDISEQLNCTYDFPGKDLFSHPIDMAYNNRTSSEAPPSDLFRSICSQAGTDALGLYLAMVAVKVTGDFGGEDNAPVTEVYQSTFFWCARTFKNVTGSAKGLDSNSGSFERLLFAGIIPAGDEAGDTRSDVRYDSYIAESTGARYNVTYLTSLNLWSYLANFLSQKIEFRVLVNQEDGPLNTGSFLYTSDLRNVTDNLATALTNQIRSKSPGDNSDAVTIKGTATFRETYIHVRWGWLILPFTETILVGFLLLGTIVVSSRQPLLKKSVIAYTVHSGQASFRSAIGTSQPVTGEEMSDAAKKITVRLTKLGNEPFSFTLDQGQDK